MLKIEVFLFLFFIIITLLYNINTDAHKYYNKIDIPYNFNGIFSLITVYMFGLYIWIALCFPVVWLLQLIILIGKNYFKKFWLLFTLVTILYFGSLGALLSLYSINLHQSMLERTQRDIDAHKNTMEP